MKSSTGKIELSYDLSGKDCDGCGALKANVDVRGGRAGSVRVRCEVADAIDGVENYKEEGVPVNQICKKIKARMRRATCFVEDLEEDEIKHLCSPLKDAVEFLSSVKKRDGKSGDDCDFGFPG